MANLRTKYLYTIYLVTFLALCLFEVMGFTIMLPVHHFAPLLHLTLFISLLHYQFRHLLLHQRSQH